MRENVKEKLLHKFSEPSEGGDEPSTDNADNENGKE